MDDLTNQYNTPLTPEEQQAYADWAKAGKRDPEREKYDYDLQGYYKSGGTLDDGHMTDQFKKPNHPTFSNESQYNNGKDLVGGQWQKTSDGKFTFTPGNTNLQHWGPQGLQDYFNKYEPGNTLIFPEAGQ